MTLYKPMPKKVALLIFLPGITLKICCYFIFQNVDLPGLSFGQQDYYPYVFFKLNLNLLEK